MTLNRIWNYSQPEQYHFAEDSIYLVESVLEDWGDSDIVSLLDIGSGCGIVSLEFLQKFRGKVEAAHLLEPNISFQTHIEKNRSLLNGARVIHYHKRKLQGFECPSDMILCNPPFYNPDKGKLPESELVMRSKFSVDLKPCDLMSGIEKNLTEGGKAYVLLGKKKNQTHGEEEFHSDILQKEILSVSPFIVMRFFKLNED